VTTARAKDGEHAVLDVGRLGKQVAAQGARFGGAARRPRTRVIAVVTAVVATAAGAGTYVLTTGSTPANAPVTNPAVTLSGPFRVIAVTPAPGSRHADGSQPVRVTFSAPPAARSPQPVLTPDVAGAWQTAGDAMTFTPTLPFSPSTRVTVTIPGGAGGVRSAAGHVLAAPMTARFTTEPYATLRLAEVLGQLGYLPMTWHLPDLGMQVASQFNSASPGLAGEETLAYDPPSGIFSWDQGYPASLASTWQPDTYNVILRGAVMAFQSEHNMTINGAVTSGLWNALFQAASRNEDNVDGYTYAVASKGSPETLTIWHDGQVVLRSLTNTGIPSEPTVDGTFPVYARFLNTIMSGTNPDGSHYADPVQFVSYFNGGDAVHYFPRGGYGYQQSLGCVELPYDAAKAAFPYLTYGSLVTVTG
jgi:L,D-transpeptidase catalytic domain/Bacterial Ig-like domain